MRICCNFFSWDPNAAWSEQTAQPTQTSVTMSSGHGAYPPTKTDSWNPNASWDQGQQNQGYAAAIDDQDDPNVNQTAQGKQTAVDTATNAPEFYKSKDPKASQVPVDPLVRPAEGGVIALITWHICYPIHYMCQKTMPDCRTEKYRNWYGMTFVISMFWISFYSYLMVRNSSDVRHLSKFHDQLVNFNHYLSLSFIIRCG